MFVDEIEIEIHAGNGGDGCIAFLREKFKPKGGPAGGNGGKGGDVYVEVDKGLLTLQDFRGHRIFKAGRGKNGEGKNRHGAKGEDVVIRVPPGTVIYDISNDTFLAEIDDNSERVLVAKGGRGGLGNSNFATSTKQTPRHATPGKEGEHKKLHLELRLIADIGVVGLPSAGKSSLVAKVSTADPKQAEYHFTTLFPKIGHIYLSGFYRVTIADLPGLIEDAHEGRGLGHQFLRHIQRTSLLMHIIAWRSEFIDRPEEFIKDRNIILNEMFEYDETLLKKPILTVLNKIDLMDSHVDSATMIDILEKLHGDKLYAISVKDGLNIEYLVTQACMQLLQESERLVENLPVVFRLDSDNL